MTTDSQISDHDRNPVDVLADEFTAEIRAGLIPSIDDYADANPEFADEIRVVFSSILAIEKVGSSSATVTQANSSGGTLPSLKIDQLGDYKIVREVGRGGMGVVFEAVQQSLGRRVAIKVLSQVSNNPKHIQRFEREAITAAGLHHTNIVPVYGVGHEAGHHYYVMQLIDGFGLDEVIAAIVSGSTSNDNYIPQKLVSIVDKLSLKKPVESGTDVNSKVRFRQVAKIGSRIANALKYAHGQGTLHRDIKPANLLADGEGTIWLADFGLAKAMEGSDVSRTGDVLGTLRFMSPEQFAGNPDARSDIFSLGLTIYELLTLKPAYGDSNRSHLIQGKRSVEQRVKPATSLDPRIPKDLDTIVMKACALEPEDRYQTAAALEEDLINFLEDRPIAARPPSLFDRAYKWCRRNPVVAGLASTTAILLALLTVLSSVGYYRAKADLSIIEFEKQRSEVARNKAEATLGISLEALDKIYQRFAPDSIAQGALESFEGEDGEEVAVETQSTISKDTAEMLEEVLGVYDQLAQQESDSVTLQREAAKANRRVGDIQRRLGNYEKSTAAYYRAIDRYEKIASSDLPIARIQNELGEVYREMRQTDACLEAHQSALNLLQPLVDQSQDKTTDPLTAELHYELARTYYLLDKRISGGPPMQGRRSPPGVGGRGGPGGRVAAVIDMVNGRGNRRSPGGGEQDKHTSAAIELLTNLQKADEGNPKYSFLLALCIRDRSRRGDRESYDQAIELLRDLVQQYPDAEEFTFELAETLSRGFRRGGRGNSSSSTHQENLTESLALLKRLVEQHPNVPTYMRSLARAYQNRGELATRGVLKQAGNTGEKAIENIQQLITLQTILVKSNPDSQADKIWLARMKESLAMAFLNADDKTAARNTLLDSISISEQLLDNPDFAHGAERILSSQYRNLARIYKDLGNKPAAEQAQQKADKYRGQSPPRGRQNRR